MDDKHRNIKHKLESLLKGLGVGDDCVATVEKFDVRGTLISFRATVTHRQKNSFPIGPKHIYVVDTTVVGNFDIADPKSLENAKACTKLPPAFGGKKVCVSLKELASIT